jgi:hypothetical protein
MVTFPSLLNPNLWCALSDRYLFRMQVLVIAHYLLREMHITDIYANATTALGLKVTGGKSIIIEGGAPTIFCKRDYSRRSRSRSSHSHRYGGTSCNI